MQSATIHDRGRSRRVAAAGARGGSVANAVEQGAGRS